MKKLIFFILFLLLPLTFIANVHAEERKKLVVKIPELNVNIVPPKLESEGKCPYARYMWKNPEAADECFRCHSIPSMKLLEQRPDEILFYPNSDTRIVDNVAYYELGQPTATRIQQFFNYVSWHKIKHIVIEIHTTGGNLFDAWKIVGFMLEWQSKPGYTVETRVYGLAASAGTIIFVAGTPGHRFMSPNAELMFHELWTFEWYKISTPSGTEEEAKVKRHLQDNIANFIVSRTGLTKEDLDERVRHKEFWMTGEQAVELGIADKIIGDE